MPEPSELLGSGAVPALDSQYDTLIKAESVTNAAVLKPGNARHTLLVGSGLSHGSLHSDNSVQC